MERFKNLILVKAFFFVLAHVTAATTKINQVHSKQSKRVDSEKLQLEKVIPHLEGLHDLFSPPLPNGN